MSFCKKYFQLWRYIWLIWRSLTSSSFRLKSKWNLWFKYFAWFEFLLQINHYKYLVNFYLNIRDTVYVLCILNHNRWPIFLFFLLFLLYKDKNNDIIENEKKSKGRIIGVVMELFIDLRITDFFLVKLGEAAGLGSKL